MTIQRIFPTDPLPKRSRLIVGVSGGADSLGLLVLLKDRLPENRLIAAHVNYGLRGRDSKNDEGEVRRLCRNLSIPCHVLHPGDFNKRANREKRSLQDLAREMRYSYFLKLARKERAWGVAVGHHREDQAETVLDRLLRGAGPRGLSGLRPIQVLHLAAGKLKVWRPLLIFSKQQIQAFLKSRGITWREDGSNRQKKYRRNQIRHEILPFLSRWNPNFQDILTHIGDINAAEDELLEGLLSPMGKKLKSVWRRQRYSCDALAFKMEPLALQRRWIRRVAEKLTPKGRGLSFDRIEEILGLWLGREKGPRDVGFGLTAGRVQNQAYLSGKRD